jgi:hypothetical protein
MTESPEPEECFTCGVLNGHLGGCPEAVVVSDDKHSLKETFKRVVTEMGFREGDCGECDTDFPCHSSSERRVQCIRTTETQFVHGAIVQSVEGQPIQITFPSPDFGDLPKMRRRELGISEDEPTAQTMEQVTDGLRFLETYGTHRP